VSEDKIVQRLDQIINLLVFAMTTGKPQIERIKLLSRVGFGPKDIATVLGTTSNTVNVALAGIRKKEEQRKGRD
jgi:hypothetical protein